MNQPCYLGPGDVVPREVDGDAALTVRLDDGRRVEAEPAFTFPYRPQAGDRLLIQGQGARHYAIGVLAGASQPELAFAGDVTVRAVDGTLALEGQAGVELSGPQVTLRAQTLRTFADSLTEKADEAYRWVKGLLTVRAGDARRVVDGEDYSQSQETVLLAKDTVKIDGDQVHLGH